MKKFHAASRLRSSRLCSLVLLSSLAGGCLWRENEYEPSPVAHAAVSPVPATSPATNLVAAAAPAGRVVAINAQARYAVLSFPVGQVPTNDTRVTVFRAGARVGELRISGPPPKDTFTVGDIISGTAQEGDEVRVE